MHNAEAQTKENVNGMKRGRNVKGWNWNWMMTNSNHINNLKRREEERRGEERGKEGKRERIPPFERK
jgi:hypothetical protein